MNLTDYLDIFTKLDFIPGRGMVLCASAKENVEIDILKKCEPYVQYEGKRYKVNGLDYQREARNGMLAKGNQLGIMVGEVMDKPLSVVTVDVEFTRELINALEYYSESINCKNKDEIMQVAQRIRKNVSENTDMNLLLRFTKESYQETTERLKRGIAT